MASPTQRIIWTALPDGIDLLAKVLRVNLLVTPRLSLPEASSPADLSHFPAWQQWPQVAAQARYSLSIGGFSGELRPTWSEDIASAALARWQALFPAHTPVRTREFEDLSDHLVLSYPMADLARAIDALYREVAIASPTELPTAQALGQLVSRFTGYPKRRGMDAATDPAGAAFREVASRLADNKSASFQSADALHMLRTYHRPLQARDPENDHQLQKHGKDDPHEAGASWPNYKRTRMPRPEEFVDRIEFHQIVSALGQHPSLMRACALVIPFEVPLSTIGQGDHDLQVKVSWPDGGGGVQTGDDVLPITQVRLRHGRCVVRARGNELVDGWVNIGGHSAYDLLQMDVDGAGLKLSNLSTTLVEGPSERLIEDDDRFPGAGHGAHEAMRPVEPVRQGLPGLRSAGLQLARRRRDVAIGGLFDASKTLEDGLQAGSQIRLSAEDVLRGYRADVFDDGSGRWHSLMRCDGRYTLLHDGSVLTAEDEEGVLRLGATESPDGSVPGILKACETLFAWNGWSLAAPEPGRTVTTADGVGAGDAIVPPGLPLQAEAQAHPRSLPSLRFGRSYRVRMRWSDLAGGGQAFDADGQAPAIAVTEPQRYLRLEHLETPPLALVAQDVLPPASPQWDGESMQRAALRTLNETPDLNHVAITDRARRHVVPGRVGHRFAEHHGMLDRDGRVDPSLFTLLATQDNAIDEHVVDHDGSKFTFAVAPEDFPLPYLPDPLALGAALRVEGVAGIDPHVVHRIPFYGDAWDAGARAVGWPYARRFTIVALEGGGEAKWDPGRREFLVPLPKAERARVRISALPTEEGVDRMHLAARLQSENPAAWEKLKRLVLDGRHWMFTPERTLELVHAVQKPLVVPTPPAIAAHRAKGDATATLTLSPPVHSKSTVRLDVRGSWAEPVDDPTATAPLRIDRRSAPAFERRLARLEAPDGAPYAFSGDHAFADTRYRRVRYVVGASSRFREFMEPAIRNSPEGARLSVTSPEVIAWVRSSAAPPPPRVLYVIPTFGWSRHFDGASPRSWRSGGGVRVYLDRPWFATGFNEMLAVVLAADVNAPAPELGPRKAPVTQWGADPIWVQSNAGKLATFSPVLADFPLAVRTSPLPDMGIEAYPADERAIPAGPGGALDLSPQRPQGNSGDSPFAPHAVGFDAERQLWYADLVIRPHGAYFPFVRLALARYQPMSEDGLHLSSVVLTDFQQLTPDRLAIVTDVSRVGVTIKRVAVHGVSPAQGGTGDDQAAGGDIQLEVQRLAAGADPDLGWVTMEAIAVPTAVNPGDVVARQRKRTGRRGATAASQPSAAAVARERVLIEKGHALIQAGRYAEVLRDTDMLQQFLPALIDASEIAIPPRVHANDRMRLLVTEWERFAGEPGESDRRRVVYAETIPL